MDLMHRVERPAGRRYGVTLIELLIAISIIGLLASIGAASFRTPGARLFANDLRALIQQARYEAVKENVPIAVIWVPAAGEFRTVRGTVASPCTANSVLNRAETSRYPGVTVAVEFGEGLVWLPSGQARSCSLGAFQETIATISDGRVDRAVTVTLTGRVTIR